MKKGRLFAKIIYYIFTFVIGVLLALGLPYYFKSFQVPGELAAEYLAAEDYNSSLILCTSAFDESSIYQADMPKGGKIMLCPAMVNVYHKTKTDSGREQNYQYLYLTYIGYIFGTGSALSVYDETDNKLAMVATAADGSEATYHLADYDATGDGVNDGCSYFDNNGFVAVDLVKGELRDIDHLTLLDSDGNVYWQSERGLGWSYGYEGLFAVFEGIDEFNAKSESYAASTETESASSRQQTYDRMEELYNGFKEKCDQNAAYYFKSDTEQAFVAVDRETMRRSDIKAIPFVVVYFVVIYIIADFLLGNFYIIKFFEWFLFKVCKIPRKKKQPKKEEVFGHDYYSMVTLKLDLSEVPNFNGSVEIKYTNSDCEAKWILLKAENYTATQRVKAGVYVNPFIDIDRNYGPIDLPENLEVEGYRMEQTVKIVRAKPQNEPADEQIEPLGEENPPAEEPIEPATEQSAIPPAEGDKTD